MPQPRRSIGKRLKFLGCLRKQESSYQRQNAAAAQEAANRLGVDARIEFAGSDAIEQSDQLLKTIHSAPDLRPDGIICAPAVTTILQVDSSASSTGIGCDAMWL